MWDFTRAELQKYKQDFEQKKTRDLEYVFKLWSEGTNGIIVEKKWTLYRDCIKPPSIKQVT